MKTAISLPDELFLSANDLAKRQGVSRSELFAVAVADYLAKHRDADVTSRLNEVVARESSAVESCIAGSSGPKRSFHEMVIARQEVWVGGPR